MADKLGQLAAMLNGRESEPEPEEQEVPVVETPPEEAVAAPPDSVEPEPQGEPAEDPAELKRRLEQLEKSYSEARRFIQEKGELANRLQTELVAKEVLLEELRKGSQQPATPPDPWKAAGIEDLQTTILTDPERALSVVERRLSEQYDSRLAAERQQIIAEIEDRNRKNAQLSAAINAAETARNELKMDQEQWQSVLNTVAPMILRDRGEEGLYDPATYVQATRQFIERLAPSASTPSAPAQGNPPGSKRSSVAVAPPTSEPKLGERDKVILDQIKRAFPVGDDYEKRVAQRLAERRRNR